jgi:hypothetical protein
VPWTLLGPCFTLRHEDGSISSCPHSFTVLPNDCSDSGSCPDRILVLSIGTPADNAEQQFAPNEVVVAGAGRHRLLSVVAAALLDSSVGFVFLKSRRARSDRLQVEKYVRVFDLVSNYAFIAFRNRNSHQRASSGSSHHDSQNNWTALPAAAFGSIDDGILLSRAAAVLMLHVAVGEANLHRNETLPSPCSEFLIFSDAWLCWCAAELDIPALDLRFIPDVSEDGLDEASCNASSSLYRRLGQLYEQQRLSPFSPLSPMFTERTTLGFQYFMQTLAFHLVSGPHILSIEDSEEAGDSFFWDACCSRLLVDHMMFPVSLPFHPVVHPLLLAKWGELVNAKNRSAFVAIFRRALVSGAVDGHVNVSSKMSAVRLRLRPSVSAARVLGCSVQQNVNNTIHRDDPLLGTVGSEEDIAVEPLQINAITPGVLLTKHGKLVSKRLYLATHDDWSQDFGYNPLFVKDPSSAFASPDFNSHDWYLFCMFAVMAVQGRSAPQFEEHSQEHSACKIFASALSQRTYADALPLCFDKPPQSAESARCPASFPGRCVMPDGAGCLENGDPWMLRQLAKSVQSVLLERWDLQQVCFNSNCEDFTSDAFAELVRGFRAPPQQADFAGR